MTRTRTLIIGGALLFSGCGDWRDDAPREGDACAEEETTSCTAERTILVCAPERYEGPEVWQVWSGNPTGACECGPDGRLRCPSVGDPCPTDTGRSFTCSDEAGVSLRCDAGQWSAWDAQNAGSGCDCEDGVLACWDAGFIGIRQAGSRELRRRRTSAATGVTAVPPASSAPDLASH